MVKRTNIRTRVDDYNTKVQLMRNAANEEITQFISSKNNALANQTQ